MGMRKKWSGEDGTGGTVSLWEIERLLLGEIRGEEEAVLRRKIELSPDLLAYMERLQPMKPRRSFEDLRRRAHRQGNTISNTGDRKQQSGLAHWKVWLSRLLPGPGNFGSGLALGSVFVFLLGLAFWQIRPFEESPGETRQGYQSKGGEGMEILLKASGREIEPGESVEAGDGDTLSFSYRATKASHVQIWYREDGGALVPFGAEGNTTSWQTASRWTPGPQRILLEGRWQRQEVWVVASRRALSPSEAKAVVEGGQDAPPEAKAWVFRIKQTGPAGK